MSNYGIKCGVYVFRNTIIEPDGGLDEKSGKWIEVKKVTNQFVTCEYYNYYDDKINKDDRQIYYCSGKRKKMERNGTLFLWDFGIFDFKDADYYDMNGYFTSFERNWIDYYEPDEPDEPMFPQFTFTPTDESLNEPSYENCDEPSDENIENIISENFDEILFNT